MKFDIVIGNPPYNDADGKKTYCKFMLMGSKLASKYCVMVVKNKWLASFDKDGAQGFSDVHQEFLIKRHCIKIVNYPIIGEAFEDVKITVCYFLYSKVYTGDCEYIQIQNGKEVEHYRADFSKLGMVIPSGILKDIVEKVKHRNDNEEGTALSSLTIYRKPCGYTTSEIPVDVSKSGGSDDKHTVCLMTSSCRYYTTLDSFDSYYHDNIFSYNVIAGEKLHVWEREVESVITSVEILNPNETCTQSWTQLYKTNNRDKAVNFAKYLKTKFCRALIKAGYSSYGGYAKYGLRFCPMQNFSNESDIDWDQGISEIDRQLYRKYNLLSKEIEYIESTIKGMA